LLGSFNVVALRKGLLEWQKPIKQGNIARKYSWALQFCGNISQSRWAEKAQYIVFLAAKST